MTLQRDLFADGAIAHSDLRGQVTADRFTEGNLLRVAQPTTFLRLKYGGPPDREMLYGHPVLQLETQQGLSRDETSGYVGYVAPTALATWSPPTHRVNARSTLLFDEPDFKAPDPMAISCGSLLTIRSQNGKYARTHDGLYAIASHLTPIETAEPDLAKTAEILLGTPYLWAGNSAFGIDCSGLIQLCAQAAQLPCPGDSDQQMTELGTPLPKGTSARRNDLFFWKGHVALAVSPMTLIHANAHHMAVTLEPIDAAIQRIDSQGDGPVLAHKRL